MKDRLSGRKLLVLDSLWTDIRHIIAELQARMRRNELLYFELMDDLRRVSIYNDVAVLSGHSTSIARDKGEEQSATEGYTEVWVCRDGGWKLVAEEITPQE